MNLLLPTIELAKEIQADLGFKGTHMVWISNEGFTIAHTDAERATGEPLEGCHLHFIARLRYPIPPFKVER
jgi:hypothetical protein